METFASSKAFCSDWKIISDNIRYLYILWLQLKLFVLICGLIYWSPLWDSYQQGQRAKNGVLLSPVLFCVLSQIKCV